MSRGEVSLLEEPSPSNCDTTTGKTHAPFRTISVARRRQLVIFLSCQIGPKLQLPTCPAALRTHPITVNPELQTGCYYSTCERWVTLFFFFFFLIFEPSSTARHSCLSLRRPLYGFHHLPPLPEDSSPGLTPLSHHTPLHPTRIPENGIIPPIPLPFHSPCFCTLRAQIPALGRVPNPPPPSPPRRKQ